MKIEFIMSDGSRRTSDFVDPQLNFLAHAQIAECDLGSKCGGHGICGADRIRFSKASGAQPPVSPVTETEARHLTAPEIAQGLRLGCQCFPEDPKSNYEVHVGETSK